MREFAAGFYDARHPLIRLARGFEFGEVTPAAAFTTALETARQSAGYARSLAEALEAIRNITSL